MVTKKKNSAGKPDRKELVHQAEAGVAGAVAGAAVGAAAGPPGIAAGAAIGAVAGAIAGRALGEDAERRSEHDRKLDEEIGVTDGTLGAPNLQHPPAERGAYSGASAGVTSDGGQPAEGPIQVPEE
jgi:phage tail tape-measure protein